MIYAYPCDISPDEDGELVTTFADMPDRVLARASVESAEARLRQNVSHHGRAGPRRSGEARG